MEQSSFQAVTKLEQRLELMKKQRGKLKHELGRMRDHKTICDRKISFRFLVSLLNLKELVVHALFAKTFALVGSIFIFGERFALIVSARKKIMIFCQKTMTTKWKFLKS